MKKLLTILMLAPLFCGAAHTFYISASGDNTTGLSPAHAWTSLKKLDLMWSSIAGGDSVLFNRGEVFHGSLSPTTAGSAGHIIVFGAYGTGADPVISGLYTLHTWTANGTNKWICHPDSITKNNCNVFTINDIPQAVARTGWMKYYSMVAASSTVASLKSPYLTGTPNWTGGELVYRLNTYEAGKGTITSQSGNTVNYSNNTQPIYNGQLQSFKNGTDSFGFFIQRHLSAMDAEGEWYYNKSSNTMNLYSATDPNTKTIKASYIDTLITLSTHGFYTIQNIKFEGAGVYAIESVAGSNLVIQNCTFNNNTKGIYVWNTGDIRVANNNLDNSFQGAIFISNKQEKRMMVDSNTINHTGQLIGMGIYNNEFSLRGLVSITDSTRASNYNYIIGNTVKNTGNCPIYFQGSNVIVRRNITDTFANQVDDMGGIYTFNENQKVATFNYSNRTVDSNFVMNAIGAPLGSKSNTGDVAGIYWDDQVDDINTLHNTVYNVPGNAIQMNTPRRIWIRDNTVYNSSFFINENQRRYGTISGVHITKNKFYQNGNQLLLQHVNDNLNGPPAMTKEQSLTNIAQIDSNWITNTQSNSFQMITKPSVVPSSSYTTTNVNLATWKSSYAHDLVSTLPPLTVTTTNVHIYINPKYGDSVITFYGNRKQGPDGTVYDNTATIHSYGSLILIDNGTIPNLPPTSVNAGSDQVITLPTNTVSLSGSATDPEGAPISSLWTKTSGPTTGAISSPASATTSVTGLVQGVYQFTYKATDPLGANSSDAVQVTVNAPANTSPVSNAGTDQEIGLPLDSVTLVGSATDAEGGTLTYLWTHVSGTGTSWTIVSPISSTTKIRNLVAGTYDFDLAVTDNGSLVGHDAVHILVDPTPLPPNQYPVADAGSNIDVTLPNNSAILTSSASYDPDGTIVSRVWSKLSGPAGGGLTSTVAVNPTVNDLQEGVYRYQVVVKDNNDSTDNSTVLVTVHPQPANIAPSVDAGIDKSIRFPVQSVTLVADTSDSDGYIETISWVKTDGGPGDNIVSAASKSTLVTFLFPGIYQYRVTVTDDRGGSAIDYVIVTVLAAYVPPTISTGGNISIVSPMDSVLLSGSASDVDGTISTVLWTKLSGPIGGTIDHPDSLITKARSFVPGYYVYQLSVTDNDGLNSTITMVVTVSITALPASKVEIIGYKINTNTPNPQP